MKILVFAHRLEVGGTQANAIDLAAGMRDLHGCTTTLFATPGPMLKVAQDKGLRFVPAPDAYLHPSVARMRALRALVRCEKPDLVHAWDWWQCLDAYYSVHLPMGVPMVVSDMMMDLTRVLPKQVWTTFGTPELVDRARAAGRGKVELIVPPVDVRSNAPDAVDPRPFRNRFAPDPSQILLVTVSRLALWMKLESLMRSIQAVRALGSELPVKLVIVGDGAARRKLEELAMQANAHLGREAVVLAGALIDPRPAYAAADIVIGMGGSSLRGLAFGKPVIVVGEQGFSAPFNPDTAESFYYRGMYGLGDGDHDATRLTRQIRELAEAAASRAALGSFSRHFACERFSLEAACSRLATVYSKAAAERPSLRTAAGDALRTAAVYLRERRFLTASRDRHPVDAMRSAAQ